MHHDGARSAPQPEQPPTLEALVTRGPSRTTLAAPRWGKAVQGQIAFEVTTSDLAIVASPHTTRSEEVTDAPGERAELALECPNSLTDCVPFSHQATEPQRSRFVKSSSGPPDIRFRNGTVALVADVGIRDTRAMRSRRHLPVRSAPSSAFAGYRFPPEVIAPGGPVVPAVRPFLSRRRGAPGGARHRGRSREHLPVGPAVRAGVRGGGSGSTARHRGSLACR